MVDEDSTRTRRAIEIGAAVVLGLAAVLTAWSAYRTALVDDKVLANYSNSLAKVAEANDTFGLGDQALALEQNLFFQYAVQLSLENEFGATYLFESMAPELQAAVVAWQDDLTSEAATPFSEDNPAFLDLESQQLYATGAELLAEADELRMAAEVADEETDVLGLAEVFFALTLFVAGFAALLRRNAIQISLLILAATIMLVGVGILISA